MPSPTTPTPDEKADVFEVDLEDLTIAEVEEFEDLTDLPFDEALRPGAKKGKALRGLAVILKRRENPDFSWEDAGRLRIATTPEDPTPPADGGE